METSWHLERSIPVPECGCWIWTGAQCGKGYGLVSIGRRTQRAHRVAFHYATGVDPGSMHVLHKCDTPSCINPMHLMLGTNTDNVADKVAKNRQARGEKIGLAMCGERQGQHKLTASDVVAIRESDLRVKELSLRYGVSPSVISEVRSRKAWKHIEEFAA